MSSEKPKIALAIVPTGGIVNSKGSLEPTERGKLRIQKTIEVFEQGRIEEVAIIGGKRLSGPSEAEVYRDHMVELCPEMAPKVVIVDASDLCTNRDLPAARKKIQFRLEGTKERMDWYLRRVWVTGYKDFLNRIETILSGSLHLENIEQEESGEVPAYPPLVEKIFNWVTVIDHEWRWLGAPIVWLAWYQRYRGGKDHV